MTKRLFVLVVALLGVLGATAAPAVAAPAPPPEIAPAATQLIGGNALMIGPARCTIGFNAYHPRGVRYIVTVGCGTPAGGGAIVAPADTVSTALVRQGGGTMIVGGSSAASIAQPVCMFGSTSGYRCGSVTGLNQTINLGGGQVITGLIRTNVCAQAGDNGSPLYRISGGKAYAIGVLVGGSGNCSTGGTTFFKPIASILSAYGLTLYTG